MLLQFLHVYTSDRDTRLASISTAIKIAEGFKAQALKKESYNNIVFYGPSIVQQAYLLEKAVLTNTEKTCRKICCLRVTSCIFDTQLAATSPECCKVCHAMIAADKFEFCFDEANILKKQL